MSGVSTSRRILIFNADDYGLSPSISAGILASSSGVVRSTSVMANFVTEDEARALMESGMSIGGHLNLSTGYPLSSDYPEELLLPDGRFNKELALQASTWESQAMRDAALREWWAQLDRISLLGIHIDHLDSHHHTHLLEPLFTSALDLALARRLGLRVRGQQYGKAWAAGVPAPEHFYEGFFGYNNIGRAGLLEALSRIQGAVVEVMCHPGIVDMLAYERTSYQEEREAELALLGDALLVTELEAQGWTIGGYVW
ncbi:ChbG/HpnK family deacetylase [bacterium]|nr:ChbG/HpnK family deacetylase [bacterium]